MARRAVALLLVLLAWTGAALWWLRSSRPAPAPAPARGESGRGALVVVAPPPRWLAWVGGGAPPARLPAKATSVVSAEPTPKAAPSGVVDRSAAPVLPLPSEPADPALLARATVHLVGAREGRLGDYRFLGEVDPPAGWSRLPAALDAAYRERVGLAPIGEARETIVLFADRERYRALQDEQPRLAGLRAAGHTASGLVALVFDPGDADESEATLVHELVHLLNRRALGPALPLWLDEGLAEEFAQTRFDAASGRFLWGERRGGVRREGQRLVTSGGLAGLERLARALASPSPPTLTALVARDREAFVADPADLSYPQAREWVEFLLQEDATRAVAFRRYLAGVARGEPVSPEALERALGAPLAALEPDFRAATLRAKARALDAEIAALTATGERVNSP